MSPAYLLDTNIFIHIRQRRPAVALARFAALEAGQATMSVVTYGELMHGVEKSAARTVKLRELEEMTSLIPVLPLPIEAGGYYGALRHILASKGQIIGSNDLWIASHALAARLILVTNNEREFRRIPELVIENWAK